jgi:hypothetical protein
MTGLHLGANFRNDYIDASKHNKGRNWIVILELYSAHLN